MLNLPEYSFADWDCAAIMVNRMKSALLFCELRRGFHCYFVD